MMASPWLRRAVKEQATRRAARPIAPHPYTDADRAAFDARYGWPPAKQVRADANPRTPLLPRNCLDVAIGFAIGMSALASLQAVAPALRIIAQ